jgi:hypothetical protein
LTDATGLWRGHRTWLVDGVSMPDTPGLQRAFGQPTNQARGCGFPVALVLALFHAGTGLLQHLITAPLRSHEMSRVALLHLELRPGDVLVGDRAFGTLLEHAPAECVVRRVSPRLRVGVTGRTQSKALTSDHVGG